MIMRVKIKLPIYNSNANLAAADAWANLGDHPQRQKQGEKSKLIEEQKTQCKKSAL